MASPEGATCRQCFIELDSSALKCVKCTAYVHLGCSGVPEYLLVHYNTSQCSYTCIQCVKDDMGDVAYNRESGQLKDIIQRERLKVEEIDRLNSTTADQLNNTAGDVGGTSDVNGIETGGGRVQNDSSQNNSATRNEQEALDRSDVRRNICQDYLRKKCRFGKSGNVGGNCPNSHPRLCFKFLKYGNRDEKGCKRGERCKFHHPKICWQFSKRGKCTREDCTFYHVVQRTNNRTAKRTEGIRPIGARGGHNSRSSSETTRNQQTMPSAQHGENRRTQSSNNINSNSDDFLSMRKVMQAQLSQLQQMMQLIVERPLPREDPPRLKDCRCSHQCC